MQTEMYEQPALSVLSDARTAMALPSDVRKGFALPFAEKRLGATPLPGRSPLKINELTVGRAEPYRTSDGRAVSSQFRFD